jgi:hypothetical protein
LNNELTARGWNQNLPSRINITVNSNIILTSTTTSTPALIIPALAGGSARHTINVINNGTIIGKGGAGGLGGVIISNIPQRGNDGSQGGTAIRALQQINLTNNSIIAGGGGGGGGGGAYRACATAEQPGACCGSSGLCCTCTTTVTKQQCKTKNLTTSCAPCNQTYLIVCTGTLKANCRAGMSSGCTGGDVLRQFQVYEFDVTTTTPTNYRPCGCATYTNITGGIGGIGYGTNASYQLVYGGGQIVSSGGNGGNGGTSYAVTGSNGITSTAGGGNGGAGGFSITGSTNINFVTVGTIHGLTSITPV